MNRIVNGTRCRCVKKFAVQRHEIHIFKDFTETIDPAIA